MSKDKNKINKEIRENFKQPFINATNDLENDPLAGEILGILIFENKALSVQELSERTGYSVSHISNKIRQLKNKNFVKEERKPGSRKNYYKIEDVEEWSLKFIQEILDYTQSIIEVTNISISNIDDENKKNHLNYVKEKYKNIYKSLKLLQKVDEDELNKLFNKYEIKEP